MNYNENKQNASNQTTDSSKNLKPCTHCPNCSEEKSSAGNKASNIGGTPGKRGEQKYFPALDDEFDDELSNEIESKDEIEKEYLI